jgi:hypothetical protein
MIVMLLTLFFLLMSFFCLCFLGREPGDGPSQRVATIIMLICAGWLPQDNQIDRELPPSICVGRAPKHVPQ